MYKQRKYINQTNNVVSRRMRRQRRRRGFPLPRCRMGVSTDGGIGFGTRFLLISSDSPRNQLLSFYFIYFYKVSLFTCTRIIICAVQYLFFDYILFRYCDSFGRKYRNSVVAERRRLVFIIMLYIFLRIRNTVNIYT